MKTLGINTELLEDLAADRMMWRSTLNQHLKTGEEKLANSEGSATTPTDQRPHTNATLAAEIVSSASVPTATGDAATVEQTGQPGCTPMIVGLVVKASASRAEDPGFEPRLCRDLFGVESYQ